MMNMPVLVLDGAEYGIVEFLSGLTQGCPASCILYVIGVDPMLAALCRMPRLKCVSGFVDDWTIGCLGLGAVAEVSALMADFERASGQQLNRNKSAAIPARQLKDSEKTALFAAWGHEMRISLNERVLAVYIGIHTRIHDQYREAMVKFDDALALFTRIRSSM